MLENAKRRADAVDRVGCEAPGPTPSPGRAVAGPGRPAPTIGFCPVERCAMSLEFQELDLRDLAPCLAREIVRACVCLLCVGQTLKLVSREPGLLEVLAPFDASGLVRINQHLLAEGECTVIVTGGRCPASIARHRGGGADPACVAAREAGTAFG